MFSEGDVVTNRTQGETPEFLVDCLDQLEQYFKGERHEFTFPYTFEGTDFQKTVWNALTKVPCAETVSYKDIAVSIGNEKAVRAVGTANGKNKLKYRDSLSSNYRFEWEINRLCRWFGGERNGYFSMRSTFTKTCS